jgi:hypothetical protein
MGVESVDFFEWKTYWSCPNIENKKSKSIMKQSILLLIAASLLLAVTSSRLFANDTSNKEVTLTGMCVCAKCVLHETTECQNVLQIQKDGKTVNYYLDQNDISKAFHDNICTTSGEKVTATGIVSEKDGKQVMTVSKIEPAK